MSHVGLSHCIRDMLTNSNQSQQVSLSVIVPSIGLSRHLYSAFISVFQQSCTANEIVVVWNGCREPDWFACIEEKALQHHIRLLKIFHKEQVDISVSWSSGAEAASSELLYFLGDDDLIDLDFFYLAKRCFSENPDLDVFAANARYINEAGDTLFINHISDVHSGSDASKIHVSQSSPWFEVPPPIFASVHRRQKLASIGYFSYQGLAFDVWMFHHLAMGKGYRLVYIHEPKVSYRRSSTSASNQICNHALSYVEGLLQFQRNFNFTPFRPIAANFALTAISRNRTKPLLASRFVMSIARMGFAYDLFKAAVSRAISKLGLD